VKDFCICILAHNEERHIRNTILSLVREGSDFDCDIIVYANGCTDKTVSITAELSLSIDNLHLRELKKASKPLAWNRAFSENKNEILFFSDGDIVLESGTIAGLHGVLEKKKDVSLVGCSFSPRREKDGWEQIATSFLQIPFGQNFLAGGFYAVRRVDLEKTFNKFGLTGMPAGLVAEDGFLERIIGRMEIVPYRVFYEPPSINDYLRYLARIRWQNEQLDLIGHGLEISWKKEESFLYRFIEKIKAVHSVRSFVLGALGSSARFLFKKIYAGKIAAYYHELGPVVMEQVDVLNLKTRSESTK
jgi:glycosyltransferase involved in cell wall biosynthesis